MTEEEIHARPNYGLPPSESSIPRIRTNAEMGFPEYKIPKKRKKSTYVKPQSIKQLEIDYKKWHYAKSKYMSIEQGVDFKFSDKNTNELTKSVMGWFKCHGGFSQRVNSGATFDPRLGIFRKGSGSTTGAADTMNTLMGLAIHVEIKFGRDRQRPEQIEFQKGVEAAGGIYFIAKTYDNFLEQINKIISNMAIYP